MNYSKYAKIAKQKLTQYGGDCVITRKIEETYNPQTNEYENTVIKINGKGVISNYSVENIDGTNVLAGDVSIMAVFDDTPKINDELKIGDKEYHIVNFTELNPNGSSSIYYKIQAR